MFSVPVLEKLMYRLFFISHLEFGFCIFTVPFAVLFLPMYPSILESCTPFCILRVPVPSFPAPRNGDVCVRSELRVMFWLVPLMCVISCRSFGF